MEAPKDEERTKPSRDPNLVTLAAGDDEDARAAVVAQAALRPSFQAAATIRAFPLMKDNSAVTLGALAAELQAQFQQVKTGDLGRAEAILTAQAHALDAIFGLLARRAATNLGEYIGAAETYLRLALKAQSQCRATLETLAAMKNPAPVAFVRQANISAGPQQVNNAPQADGLARGREIESTPIKLSEAVRNELPANLGASPFASGTDTQVETVAAIERTENGGGQG